MPENSENDATEQMIDEILGDVEYYAQADGPEGPWHYRSLTIRRVMNTILVYDVDGVLHDTLRVEGFNELRSPKKHLRRTFDRFHAEAMDEL